MISALDLTQSADVTRLKNFSNREHPSSFRYFKTRVFDIAIKTHVLTVLYTIDDADVGYAHVDIDTKTQRAYFGICVIPEYQQKGIGSMLLEYVLSIYDGVLYLTVDNDNMRAINLYKKYNFTCVETGILHTLWRREPSS